VLHDCRSSDQLVTRLRELGVVRAQQILLARLFEIEVVGVIDGRHHRSIPLVPTVGSCRCRAPRSLGVAGRTKTTPATPHPVRRAALHVHEVKGLRPGMSRAAKGRLATDSWPYSWLTRLDILPTTPLANPSPFRRFFRGSTTLCVQRPPILAPGARPDSTDRWC